MKVKVIILILICLAILSCNRFNIVFDPPESTQRPPVVTEIDFITSFADTTTYFLRENDIDAVMSFYSPDYINGGMTFADREDFYRSVQWTEVAEMTISPAASRANGGYDVTITDGEETYSWVDYAERHGVSFWWVGSQRPYQVVLTESFTGIYCQYCPLASQKLHEISEIYPNRFIFIEYFSRANDPLGILEYNRFQREKTYYGVTSEPFTAFHGGINTINGLGPNNSFLANYQLIIERLINTEATISLSNLSCSINGDDISGSVKIAFTETVNPDLYLHYAVYEETVQESQFYYQQSIPVSHAVCARGYQPLDANTPSGQTINFTLQVPAQTTNNYHLYPLDTDTKLVVWVQRKQNDNTYVQGDQVFYAVEKPLF